MSKILLSEIDRLEKSLLRLSTVAEESLHKAVKAVLTRDPQLARSVIAADAEVDEMEVELEEDCLKVLALHQPVASDLRYIVVMLKINNDLERVGDLATNIAQRALLISDQPEITVPFDLQSMAEKVWTMIRDSVDALVRLDEALAGSVRELDKEVDRQHHANYDQLAAAAKKNIPLLDAYIAYLSVSRSLERIADHATNIAEDVVYLLEGAIVRHDGMHKQVPDAAQPPQGDL